MTDNEKKDHEVAASLVGETIVGVIFGRSSPDSSWPQGDPDITLFLSDGRRIRLSGWGYDACGLNIEDETNDPDASSELHGDMAAYGVIPTLPTEGA